MAKIIAGIIVLILLFMGLNYLYYSTTIETVSVNIIDTDRIVEGSGNSTSSKYLVFTEEETFENTDCLWAGKFNSSDMQGQLSKKGSHTFVVYGWRIPFLSNYRNILKVTN